jgi:DNA-binding transcriptional MerR regulator
MWISAFIQSHKLSIFNFVFVSILKLNTTLAYKEKEIEKLYYTIGEVSDMLGLNASQIRYWESEFDKLKPRKDRGGNRIYTKEDIEVIKLIHHLVKEKGFTIEGARTKLKNGSDETIKKMKVHDSLKRLRDFLEELKESL